MLFSYPSSTRRGLALRLLALSFFSLTAAAAIGAGGCSSSSACDDSGKTCAAGYICVETCGGKVISSGCCPCAEGTFDTSACEDGGAGDGG